MITRDINPEVSIVVPFYNVEKYLDELINSVLHQTYFHWQLLLIDDGSTDRSFEIAQKYARQDNRIICKRRPDNRTKGAQACRNLGLEMADSNNAEFVVFIDSDDILAPYCLKQRVEYMREHKELDFAIFPAATYYDNERSNRIGEKYGLKYTEDDLESFFWNVLPFVVWNNIYRVASLLRRGMSWDENLLSLQDSDYNIQSILKGLKYSYPQNAYIDYFWRQSDGTISTKVKSLKHQDSHLYLIKKIFDTLSENQIIKYNQSLKFYLTTYTRRFALAGARCQFNEMLRIPWLKVKLFFKLRLRIYYIIMTFVKSDWCRRQVLRFLFPSLLHSQKIIYFKKALVDTTISSSVIEIKDIPPYEYGKVE